MAYMILNPRKTAVTPLAELPRHPCTPIVMHLPQLLFGTRGLTGPGHHLVALMAITFAHFLATREPLPALQDQNWLLHFSGFGLKVANDPGHVEDPLDAWVCCTKCKVLLGSMSSNLSNYIISDQFPIPICTLK